MDNFAQDCILEFDFFLLWQWLENMGMYVCMHATERSSVRTARLRAHFFKFVNIFKTLMEV